MHKIFNYVSACALWHISICVCVCGVVFCVCVHSVCAYQCLWGLGRGVS